jgi:hypothetical protein
VALNYRWIVAGIAVWAVLPLLARDKETPEPALPAEPPRDFPEARQQQVPPRNEFSVRRMPAHTAQDLRAVFTSPRRLRRKDVRWLLPLATATCASVALDRHVMTHMVPQDEAFHRISIDVSDTLITALLATPVALFALGNLYENEKEREAGFVAGEAVIDAFILDHLCKLGSWRERPDCGTGKGLFFNPDAGGLNSSFLSSHSMVAWTVAAVLANEYPDRRVEAAVYTTAAAISISRVLGRRHFPTDVLLGGAIGWFLGHYVYRARHRFSLPSDEPPAW